MNDTKFALGQQLSIFLSGATTPTSVVVEMVHVVVAKTTDKAVYVTFAAKTRTYGCWLPKKALITRHGTESFEVARWFSMGSYERFFFSKASTVGGVSVPVSTVGGSRTIDF
jgi:hypothetical protein